MTYVPGSFQNTAGLLPDSGPNNASPLTAGWNVFTKGSTSSFSYKVTLDTTIHPSQVIPNTAKVTWTSLPGDVTSPQSTFNNISTERTGNTTDPGGAANTYSAQSTFNITVYSPAPAKTQRLTSEDHTQAYSGIERVAIGEIVRYRLVARVAESTLTAVQFLDTLPSGMQF